MMSTPVIRYMADTTITTEIGRVALQYLKGMLQARLPVRVGSMSGGFEGIWTHYLRLATTPMEGDCINVVCCDPARWTWEQHCAIPKRMPDGSLSRTETEDISAWQDLYTHGMRNVLITDVEDPGMLTGRQAASADSYQAIVLSTMEAFALWKRPRAVCIPLPLGDDASARIGSAILGDRQSPL